jgi:hypothetical protein
LQRAQAIHLGRAFGQISGLLRQRLAEIAGLEDFADGEGLPRLPGAHVALEKPAVVVDLQGEETLPIFGGGAVRRRVSTCWIPNVSGPMAPVGSYSRREHSPTTTGADAAEVDRKGVARAFAGGCSRIQSEVTGRAFAFEGGESSEIGDKFWEDRLSLIAEVQGAGEIAPSAFERPAWAERKAEISAWRPRQ